MSERARFPDPHPENLARVLAAIGPEDRVLDVGGWWKPLCRADVVLDALPHATRAQGGRLGEGPERFCAATWHQVDICEAPWPFEEGAFDFAYCGQTLEDVRDPVVVCRELVRVARRGYVEVPSLWVESLRDVDVGPLAHLYPGYEKHRWLVHIDDGQLAFIPKQVWLGLYDWIDEGVADRYRGDQRLWTEGVLWEGELPCEEWLFVGQREIVPFLREYFATFDYGPYRPSGPPS